MATRDVIEARAGTQATPSTVTHLANFPLPPQRADFGAEAVETMRSGDVLVVLFEHGSESARAPLFSAQGVPRILAKDFDRNALQHGIEGQSGVQRFFTAAGRAFCLYIVVGDHIDRADVMPDLEAVLASLSIT